MKFQKKTLAFLIMSLMLAACNGEGDAKNESPTNPTDPTDPTDPTNPEIVEGQPTLPTAPTDPNNLIKNNPPNFEVELPENPMTIENPIVTEDVIQDAITGDAEWRPYTDGNNGLPLFSKYSFSEENGDIQIDDYYTEDVGTGNLYSVYNRNEMLTPNYGYTATLEVKESLGRVNAFFNLFSDRSDFINNLYSGNAALNCLIAIDYENNLNNGAALEILTSQEALDIKAAQDLLSAPEKVSQNVINNIMRIATLNNTIRKTEILPDAVVKYRTDSNLFNESEENSNLAHICGGKSQEYNSYMTAMGNIYDNKVKTLEVEFKRTKGLTKAYQNKLMLTGFNVVNPEDGLLTPDLIDNLLVKQMILNRIFNWNGDEGSYLSKYSFTEGKFFGLYEGIAVHFANQNISDRNNSHFCNVTFLNSACKFPEVYGDSGLFISYLLSAPNGDTLEQIAKEEALEKFIKDLEVVNVQGCGVNWVDVNNDQVVMSDTCIEKTFNDAGFTHIDGTALTWDDLSVNYLSYLEDYKSVPTHVSSNSARETLTYSN